MYEATIAVKFDSGHRLLNHRGKCATPHGHTYRAEITVAKQELDDVGISVDFTDLKKVLRQWIDANWDHAFLINSIDLELVSALRSLSQHKIYEFKSENPTAEVMARYLFGVLAPTFGATLIEVAVNEGQDSVAIYRPDLPVREKNCNDAAIVTGDTKS